MALSNGYEQVWDMATGTKLGTVVANIGGPAIAVGLSDDGTTLVAGSGSQVSVVDVRTAHPLKPARIIPSTPVADADSGADRPSLSVPLVGWSAARSLPVSALGRSWHGGS